jgi:putative ABC transport system permease protein
MNLKLFRPSWRKVLADLTVNKTRTLLVVASIAVGVFAVGAIVTTYTVMSEDIAIGYASAQPANIEVITDPFDDTMVKSIERIPEVTGAEGRHMLSVRVGLDGETWRPLNVVAADDCRTADINLLELVNGTIYPEDRELMVREDQMNTSGLQSGDVALVQLTDGTVRRMPVVGQVGDQYAAGDFAAPPRGYVTLDTVEWLGGQDDFNRLYVQVEDGNDEEAIDAIATEVEDKLERAGHQVFRTNTDKTTEHPMANTILAIISVLLALGVLVMLLSSSLIFNTLNALLTQHRRQIGVMKLVGARSFQISVMYISLIIVYGLIALVIAVPTALVAGYGLASVMANLMSVELRGFRIIPATIIVQVLVAFVVPLIAGYFPVTKGSKTTVRRAINEDGPGNQPTSSGMFDQLGIWLKWLSRPILLSIRNTFRHKGRLALTLFTLIIAGAIFIAVFNVRLSLNAFMDVVGQHFMADVTVAFKQPYRVAEVEKELYQVPGVKNMEGWGGTTAEIVDENDNLVTNLIISAPPGGSELLEVDMSEGRWLLPEDEKALVVSDTIWDEYPDFQIGDTLRIDIPGQRSEEWPVVGIFRFIGLAGDMLAYANYETISQLTNSPGKAATFRVVADGNTLERQDEVSKAMDQHLRERGYQLSNVEAGLVTRKQQAQGMNILVIFLLSMAILTAVVGSIGLTGTMGMNVLERTREIGVMRAIGAVDGEIIKSVVVEGLVIGLMSWVVAGVLSFPISFVLLRLISSAMLGADMQLRITIEGFLIWLAVVVILSTVASMWPARNAARLTIREVLAYE